MLKSCVTDDTIPLRCRRCWTGRAAVLLSENDVGLTQSMFIVESAELDELAKSAELAVLAECVMLESFERFGEM